MSEIMTLYVLVIVSTIAGQTVKTEHPMGAASESFCREAAAVVMEKTPSVSAWCEKHK